MSRIGRQPVSIPQGVTAEVSGQSVKVKGPKGELSMDVHPAISVKLADGQIVLDRSSDGAAALHGTMRALVNNMVVGVSQGYEKRLEVVGVGYQAQMRGPELALIVGYSHPVVLTPPASVTVELPNPTHISISGPDKQAVGEFAAKIRRARPPEPYKGKGIKYQEEVIRRKAGKAFVSGE